MLGALLVLGGLSAIAVGCLRLRPAYHVYRGGTDDVVAVERADGPVEVEGTATASDGAIESPLTKTPCLAYEYEIEELQSSGKHSSWNTVDEGRGAVPFRLEDETASVRVDPEGATLALSTDATAEVGGGEPEPDRIREFLETESDLDSQNTSFDLGPLSLATGNDRKYHERRLDPDGEAYVLGQSRYDVDARETMRDVSAVIGDGPATPAFVVSDSCQEGTTWLLTRPAVSWLLGGVTASLAGGWLLAADLLV